jgi:8-oxo-dGTP pyrophosphatase MutT (NUDIX family)
LEHGHLTGSAWIVNHAGDKVLLLHHRKLEKWIQPGGHADGEFNLLSVALREAREESGLSSLSPLRTEIFDLDIHVIPERNGEPAHLHYDLRYALTADDTEALQGNNESHALAWIALDGISDVTDEESVLRMQRKWLAGRLRANPTLISP